MPCEVCNSINKNLINNCQTKNSGEILINYDRTRLPNESKKGEGMSGFWKNIIWAIVLITLIILIF